MGPEFMAERPVPWKFPVQLDSHPHVCGGEPCLVRTRISVWLLEQARRLGTSEQELLEDYPSLRAEDLVNAWAYVRIHGALGAHGKLTTCARRELTTPKSGSATWQATEHGASIRAAGA